MLVVRNAIFDVPTTEGTVFTVMDANPWTRTAILHNRGSTLTLTLQLQLSTDGGATWSDYGDEFTMGIDGSGTEVATKTMIGTGMFRLRGSGGANNQELEISLAEFVVTASTQFPWVQA